MRVSFKDVGQGDSIIIEWNDGMKNKIGIIDCSLRGKENPVLKHIVENNYKEIEFLILSHPHKDHYSGLYELFEYVDNNNIIINMVWHTITHAHVRFWKYFEMNSVDSRLLNKIIHKSRVLKERKIIKRIDALTYGVIIDIEDNINLKCLAPSHDTIEEYQKKIEYDAEANPKEASKAANYLATIFKLQIGNVFVLLTSDAESLAFDSLLTREGKVFFNKEFQLCQIPHHGSNNNYNTSFWDSIKINTNRHAIISAGSHKTYNHPSYQIIELFSNKGYKIHCTNIVNGMHEYVQKQKEVYRNSCLFDTFSVVDENYIPSSGNRVFEIEQELFKLI